MATAHHHIVLSNPFALPDTDNDDSSLDSSAPHTPTTTTTQATSGLRAQLNHLLPRHAFFHVNVHIHQITNIPLVSGEFAIKWKFKNAHSASGAKSHTGLLSGFKARRKARQEGKRKEDYTNPNEAAARADSVSQRTNSIDGHASMWSGTSTTTSSSSSSSSSKGPKSLNTTTTSSSTSSAPALPPSVPPLTTPAHGQTPFMRLKDHGVAWEYTLSLMVRMEVDRTPQSMLLSCPLKLTVLQRDPTRPELKPVPFGVVMLDLAQYACKGEVTRRYLLRESKTNATLKLTTQLTHLPTTHAASSLPPSATSSITDSSAPSTPITSNPHATSTTTNTFTAPPLPKGEILNGISSILQGTSLMSSGESDVYRVRPKGLELYGPYYDQEELEFDLLGGRVTPKNKGKGKGNKGKERETDAAPVSAIAGSPVSVRTRDRSGTQSFDPSRLPLAYGARTTEALIEALFNPVETRYVEKESPFTVYVPPKPIDPFEGMPKRPGATPIQRPETPTSYIDSSPPTSYINTSPSRSKTGSNPVPKGTSPSVSFAVSSPRSGETALSGRSISGSPYTSPIPPPSIMSRSASSSPYFTSSPQPSAPTSPYQSSTSPSVPATTTSSPSSSSSPSSGPTPMMRTSTMMSTKSTKSSGKKRPKPERAGSAGIGAGLGIMGLGMGMGVGMGVGIGVSGPGQTNADGEVPAPAAAGEPSEKRKGREREGSGSGVKAWLKRAAKGPSRPGTPTTSAQPTTAPVIGVASS